MDESNPNSNLGDDVARYPDVIARYLDAHDRRATAPTLTTFATDATVVDERRTYTGTDAIRQWLDTTASKYTYTRTLLDAHFDDGTWVLHNRLVGDFPGNIADLRYRFTLADDLITELVIAP
jgi:hypothetical protein